jgi:hypothetical protein
MDNTTALSPLHELWCRDWWPLAKGLLWDGYDVTVRDPDVLEDESWWDGLSGHGVLTVSPSNTEEWSLTIRERDALGAP